MTKHHEDYFFIRSDRTNNPRLPAMFPDTNTAERGFRYVPEPPGSAPLIFTNGWKEEFKQRGVRDDVADILFDASNLVVRDHIRERLLHLEIPNLYIHPAVYIDDRGEWHEDYWYLTFANVFDCWDRATSDYDEDEPIGSGTDALYGVFQYSLNTQLLDETPLQDRLLFKMGGTLQAMIVCHKSLAGIFRSSGSNGAKVQAIADY